MAQKPDKDYDQIPKTKEVEEAFMLAENHRVK